LTLPLTFPLEQDINFLADEGAIVGDLLLIEKRLKPGQPLGFDGLLDHLLAKRGGRRAGARAVFEAVSLRIADIADKLQRVFEILIAFAREADDEVARKREVGAIMPQPVDDAAVLIRRMAAVHGGKDAVRA